jgi:hypothetical protein
MPDGVGHPGGAGEYRYLLNGGTTAITETWARQIFPGGRQRITSRRNAPGVEITVDAIVDKGLVLSCLITWQSGDASIQADYAWRESALECRRTREGAPPEEQAIVCDQAGPRLLFPLMRAFTGPLISRLLDNDGTGQVFVPDISRPGDPEMLLRPRVSQRHANILDVGAKLDIDGMAVPCRLCEYTGEQYGAGSRFWLGEDETLLRYQWQQGSAQHWDVWLRTETG